MLTGTSDREIVITRMFNAPRELVFKAFIQPKHMAAWWGPHGYTNPEVELDVREGGEWRIVMRSLEGEDNPVGGTYLEIKEPERLVYSARHLLEFTPPDVAPPVAIHDLTFETQGNGTLLTAVVRLETVEDRDIMIGYQMEAGWLQSMEKLEILLAQL